MARQVGRGGERGGGGGLCVLPVMGKACSVLLVSKQHVIGLVGSLRRLSFHSATAASNCGLATSLADPDRV